MSLNSHGRSDWVITVISLILFSGPLQAATYYVAPNGNNANGGLTEQAPLATIGYALTLVRYGDTILLRGGTYREGVWHPPPTSPLMDPAEASWDNMLTIRNYPGEVPVIKGSVEVDGWEPYADSIWSKANWTVRSQQVFENGEILQQIGWSAPTLTDPNIINPVGIGLDDMVPGSFYYDVDAEILYVWLADSGDPNQAGRLMEVSVRDPFHSWYDFVRVQGIVFRHSNVLATSSGWPAVNIYQNSIFEDCDVQWCDYAGFSARAGSRVLNCNFSNNGDSGSISSGPNMIISNCTFFANNYRHFSTGHDASGLKMISDSDMAGTVVAGNHVADNEGPGIWFDSVWANSQTVIIKNNYIHDNVDGIYLEVSTNFLVYNNLVTRNTRRAVHLSGAKDCRVFNNTFATADNSKVAVALNPAGPYFVAGNSFSNNVVASQSFTAPATFAVSMGLGNINNFFDYNCYFATNGPLTFSINLFDDQGGLSVFPIDFQTWRTYGLDLNSINVDPLFLNPAAQQYWPWTNSPIVSAGADLDGIIPEDIEGAPRPVGARSTIGAYELAWVDSDLDGIEDGWESLVGLDPQDPTDALLDGDGDGVSNLQEYLRNTHPGSSASANLSFYVRENGGLDTLSGFYPVALNFRHGPKRSIGSALTDALNGDRIQVFGGSYFEDVDLRIKQVTMNVEGIVDLRTP